VNLCDHPWVVVVTTQVGSYFRPGNCKAITTARANDRKSRLAFTSSLLDCER
jgi:hypothetical protein